MSDYNYANFGRGKSKAARMRRAIQVGKCWKCGAQMHSYQCKNTPTIAQSECAEALRWDPVQLKAEGALRPNSNASIMIDDLLSLRMSKLNPGPSFD